MWGQRTQEGLYSQGAPRRQKRNHLPERHKIWEKTAETPPMPERKCANRYLKGNLKRMAQNEQPRTTRQEVDQRKNYVNLWIHT